MSRLWKELIHQIATPYHVRVGLLLVVVCAWNGPVNAQTATWSLGSASSAYYLNNVGVGTSNPLEKFHVFGNLDGNISLRFENGSAGATAQSLVFLYNDVGWSAMTQTSSAAGNLFRIQSNSAITGGIVIRTLTGADIAIAPNDVTAFVVKGSGNVGIGTTAPTAKLHVVGDATFTGTVIGGNIQAQYQDVAEWVPSSRVLEPGTVVVLDSERPNNVLPSSTPYDTRVAGVVSAKPGILLGEGGEGKLRVATTGRLKIRVHSDRAVNVGDLLVTSDQEGMAMISEPIDVAGVKIHRPGTLLGKALEPMKPGTGEILVLLSLQ